MSPRHATQSWTTERSSPHVAQGWIATLSSLHVHPSSNTETHNKQQQDAVGQRGTFGHCRSIQIRQGQRDRDHDSVEHVERIDWLPTVGVERHTRSDLDQNGCDRNCSHIREPARGIPFHGCENETPNTDNTARDHGEVEPLLMESKDAVEVHLCSVDRQAEDTAIPCRTTDGRRTLLP